MSAEEKKLIEAAVRISDGERVDWDDLERSVSEEEDRAVVRGLRVLESISEVHRGRLSTGRPIDTQAPTVMEEPSGVEGEDGNVVRFPAENPEPPRNWGQLELIEKIGEGSFGEVYRARDTRLDREVALKLLRLRSGRVDKRATSVIREGRLMAKVRHPNVVSVYGAEDHEGCVGVWMEFVSGDTLEGLVRDRGTFGAREATLIGIELCRALAAVHKAGLVHRDVKAQNVMRAEGGRILLMDFGAGWDIAEESVRSNSSISGTPLYMAPETFMNKAPTVRSDIYSLGVLLYHLVTGSYPVRGDSFFGLREAHIHHETSLLRDERSDLPEAFIKVVEHALAWNPEERFTTAGQMEQALQAALGVESSVETHLTPGPPSATRGRRARWLQVAAAAVAGLAVLTGWFVLRDRTGPEAPPIDSTPATAEATTTEAAVPAAGSYSVEASLFRVMQDGRRERLGSGSRLAVGDKLTLELEASRALHVYVINEDESGHAYALFPLPNLDLKNPLPAGPRHALPGTRDGKSFSWEVTTSGGREHLLIVASPERLVEFEAEMGALPRPRPDQVAMAVPEEALVHLRGLGGLSEVPTTAETGSAGRLFEMADHLASTKELVEGAWVRQIELENPAED